MQVVFLPFADKINPYQRNLAQALAPYGVKPNAPGNRPLQSLFTKRAAGQLDLLHIHWATPYLLSQDKGKSILKSSLFILACLALRANGVRLVWSLHNLVGHESSRPDLEVFARRILWRVCHQIIVHCPAAVDSLTQAYRLPPGLTEKINVIPHGHFIDTYPNTISRRAARQHLGLDPSGRVWLYFGLIRPYKNVGGLIDTFYQMEGRETLLIAGKPQNQTIKLEIERQVDAARQISNKPIQARLEYIPDDEIQTYMQAADLLVLPFQDILTSSSIMLAISFGKAVVTPSAGCSPYLLAGQPQLLYDPGENDGLMKALYASRAMPLDQIGRDNLEVARRFPWALSGEKTYELYRRCLKG